MVLCLVRSGVRESSVSQLRMQVVLFNNPLADEPHLLWFCNMEVLEKNVLYGIQSSPAQTASVLNWSRTDPVPGCEMTVTSPSQNLHFQDVWTSIAYFKSDTMKDLFWSLFLPGLCSHKVLCSPVMMWSQHFHWQKWMHRLRLFSLRGGKQIRKKYPPQKQRVQLLINAWDHMQEFTNTRVSLLSLPGDVHVQKSCCEL